MTVVEMIVVVLLFSLLIGMSASTYFQSVQVERNIGAKLDLLGQAQIASLRLSNELRNATEIFAPPTHLGESRPYLIFSNDENEIIVIFVNEKKELVRLNRNKNDETKVIGHGIDRLRIYRKDRRLLNYHLHFLSDDGKQKFDLISGVTIRNNFN